VDESLPGHGPGRPVDGAEMTAVLDEFAATVTGDFKIGDILRQLAVSVTRVLAVDGAGVVTPDEDDRLLRLAFATPGPVHELESLQEALQNGPCLESHATGQVLNLGDVVEEGSWPAYQERAAQLGLSAVATIPLVARGERWGVLDLYRRERLPFSVAELTAATTLANLATSYLVVTEDRDTARQAQEELSHRAMHDTLTGLPVRWVFLEHLGHALERLPRHPGHVAVLFLDVDGLKHVNDTYGHPTGDRLLTTLVARMREALRPSDLLARIGGDEFVVLLDELADPEDVHDIVHRLLTGLAAPYRVDDSQVVTPSASIGVAHSSDPGVGSATLIAHADSAMYAAKRSGPGGYRVFDALDHAEDRAARSDRERLVAELRRAVAGDELEVHYQPIHEADGDAGATTLYAVEALLRWRHPDRGLLTAAAFIEVAEQSGLMPAIGERVMRAACQQLAAWDTAHGDRSPRHVFVNLSAPELADDDLPARARRILAETGLGPAVRPRGHPGLHLRGAARARLRPGHRRLRHGLLLPEPPHRGPGRDPQDRPELQPPHRGGHQCRCGGLGGGHPRGAAGPGRDRRGRRGREHPAGAAGPRGPPPAGLPPRPAGARRRDRPAADRQLTGS
jgi:diguanylate cyclase (GGDEF)-like protein